MAAELGQSPRWGGDAAATKLQEVAEKAVAAKTTMLLRRGWRRRNSCRRPCSSWWEKKKGRTRARRVGSLQPSKTTGSDWGLDGGGLER
jgi:hypothetical protein